MQNTMTTATAPVKCGLKLDPERFKFAIQKALTLKPHVEYVSLSATMCETQNHKGFVRVSFSIHEDGLWVICACQERRAKGDYPKACFHAAAAAIERNLFKVPQPIGALVEEKLLDSLAYDAFTRTQPASRFRPQAAPKPLTQNEIERMLAYVRRDETPYEFFVVKFGQHAFESLYNAGLIGLDGENIYAI